MQLYFAPLACSLATRICLYEANGDCTFTEVDLPAKRTRAGDDYLAVHPLGVVPTIRTDEGELLSENAAVLQYVGRRHPAARLLPEDDRGRGLMEQWLCFIGTELHKGIFSVLLDRNSPPEGARTYAMERGRARLDVINAHLTGREFVLDRFSVVDAYLVTILNWMAVTPLKLEAWPALAAYSKRLRKRPSVAKALEEELALYQEQKARHESVAAVAVR